MGGVYEYRGKVSVGQPELQEAEMVEVEEGGMVAEREEEEENRDEERDREEERSREVVVDRRWRREKRGRRRIVWLWLLLEEEGSCV